MNEKESRVCPRFHYAVELIGRRWSGAILQTLFGGERRFNELLNAIPGLSDRLLTERLRELEDAGIVSRKVAGARPLRVTYEMTSAGYALEPAIRELAQWAERYVGDAAALGIANSAMMSHAPSTNAS